MTSYENAIRRGRWLIVRRKWLPLAVLTGNMAGVLLSTPFLIIHDRAWLTVVSILVAFSGLWLRASAGSVRQPGWVSGALPEAINSRGIYSVIRYPVYTSNLLLIASLAIYTGAFWYMLVVALICYPSTLCVLMAHEHTLHAHYGELFTQWCRTTYALRPSIFNWQPAMVKIPPLRMFFAQARTATWIVLCFCAIDLMKHWCVEFSFHVDPHWLIALVALVIITLITGRKNRQASK